VIAANNPAAPPPAMTLRAGRGALFGQSFIGKSSCRKGDAGQSFCYSKATTGKIAQP